MALVQENLIGYLEDDYLEKQYLRGVFGAHLPTQFEVKIVDNTKAVNSQFEVKIEDEKNLHVQFESKITLSKTVPTQFEAEILDKIKSMSTQFNAQSVDETKNIQAQFESKIVDATKTTNSQFLANIVQPKPLNAQFHTTINDFASRVPSQFIKTGIIHRQCQGYLEDDYLSQAYLTEKLCASLHTQYEVTIEETKPLNTQFEAFQVDRFKDMPTQFLSQIADFGKALHSQLNVSITQKLHAQFQVILYNITQLRVLCTFSSRGQPVSSGGSGGQNWTAKIGAVDITAAGDFSPNNLNTDITEQRWQSQSGAISNVNLDVDCEVSQGVTIDTLAILDHNISPGATITLLGSQDAFSTIRTTINIPIEDENIYYIAPSFPLSTDQNRYWRFNINDPLNPDNFLRIGLICFGNATILSESNCITDKVKRKNVHFSDKVRTEGFTTVSNDRALKRRIGLRFQDLQFGLGDFAKLDDIFRTARTSLKCLWIPVPQQPSRFAAFGKITDLPEEEHNVKSRVNVDMDLITFNITIDESF